MSSFSTFETSIPVRPDDIDVNQHVHNSKYLDYVLAARYDQMERCYRISMDEFLERGLTWVVRISHIEHKRGLKMGDTALVKTRMEEFGACTVKVAFEIDNQADGLQVALGWLEYVLVDSEQGRPRRIPDEVTTAYSV